MHTSQRAKLKLEETSVLLPNGCGKPARVSRLHSTANSPRNCVQQQQTSRLHRPNWLQFHFHNQNILHRTSTLHHHHHLLLLFVFLPWTSWSARFVGEFIINLRTLLFPSDSLFGAEHTVISADSLLEKKNQKNVCLIELNLARSHTQATVILILFLIRLAPYIEISIFHPPNWVIIRSRAIYVPPY